MFGGVFWELKPPVGQNVLFCHWRLETYMTMCGMWARQTIRHFDGSPNRSTKSTTDGQHPQPHKQPNTPLRPLAWEPWSSTNHNNLLVRRPLKAKMTWLTLSNYLRIKKKHQTFFHPYLYNFNYYKKTNLLTPQTKPPARTPSLRKPQARCSRRWGGSNSAWPSPRSEEPNPRAKRPAGPGGGAEVFHPVKSKKKVPCLLGVFSWLNEERQIFRSTNLFVAFGFEEKGLVSPLKRKWNLRFVYRADRPSICLEDVSVLSKQHLSFPDQWRFLLFNHFEPNPQDSRLYLTTQVGFGWFRQQEAGKKILIDHLSARIRVDRLWRDNKPHKSDCWQQQDKLQQRKQ